MKAKFGGALYKERKEGILIFAEMHGWEMLKFVENSHCLIFTKKNAQMSVFITTLSIQIVFIGEKPVSINKTTMEHIELLFIHPRNNINLDKKNAAMK